MAVSSKLKIQSKTQSAITSTSSQAWGLHLNIIHSASGETTDLSDVEICVAIQHYWLSANSLSGLTVYVDYAGNTNGGSGTRGDVTFSFIDYDDNINVPIIYPLGENKRFKTVMKIKYINSTYTFSNQNEGITDLHLRIADKNFKTIKYFNLDGVKTDMEDSYSYRDNNGANETVYADNNKICIYEISSGDLIWGIMPHTNNNNIKYMVLLPKISATVNQASPTTSYESDLTANINKGGFADAKRAIYVASGSTNNNVGRILRVEVLLKNTYAPYISNDNVSVCTLTSLPDNNPTWNETFITGVTLATSNINSGFIQTCWMFSSPAINILIERLLRSWNTEQMGVVLKFTTENSGGNGEIQFGNHNSASYVYPIIVIAYQERRIIFS